MLKLTELDKADIEGYYGKFLDNLYNYLKQNNLNTGTYYTNAIIKLFHNGRFSMTGKVITSNFYDYLYLENLISSGVLVMYGVCSCRHATALLYDFLKVLDFDVSLDYFKVLKEDGCWKKVKPYDANHVVVKLIEQKEEYLLDLVNGFVLKKDGNDLILIENELKFLSDNYKDENVNKIGKVLTKYYDLKKLGIENVYNYY